MVTTAVTESTNTNENMIFCKNGGKTCMVKIILQTQSENPVFFFVTIGYSTNR